MIIPDANLLLYAYDSSSPFHLQAKKWWSSCLSGNEPVGLCGVVLFAFIRISTSRRAYTHPMSIQEASEHVQDWLEHTNTDLLVLEEVDLLRSLEWLNSLGCGANLTTDAQIAVIASRHRATVHTADTDFKRFPRVRSRNPLL